MSNSRAVLWLTGAGENSVLRHILSPSAVTCNALHLCVSVHLYLLFNRKAAIPTFKSVLLLLSFLIFSITLPINFSHTTFVPTLFILCKIMLHRIFKLFIEFLCRFFAEFFLRLHHVKCMHISFVNIHFSVDSCLL